ncbi:predicted protein [Nematostella vectensis]|uniref:FAD dependent oxidoreductase domain-containing protein n=1 Tax=Nematostella vectensis TaxID=45351 RepID=A7RWL6_NEMVE|nr:peroxisomal sarcosine oxidase [Nematostella vectensis]EDO44145.1 predicted protein [Nematostella vectensis]|eukprot:XP_001636208.1 predicted protein [Nematostella vectensis]
MDSEDVFDVCVVGAGVEGSATGRYLASRGKKALLVEQFTLPHSRGSSHGSTRLVRHGYSSSSLVSLMPESFSIWTDVEKMAGEQLLKRVGLLSIEAPPYGNISRLAANVRHVGEECLVLEGEQLCKRYPMFNFPDSWRATLEPGGGYIMAAQALKALQDQFVQFGGVLQDGEKVLEIIPGDIIKIKTSKAIHRAKSVVITAGPWINKILKPLSLQLPVEVWRVLLCFWKPSDPERFTAESGFPGFIFYGDESLGDHNHIYGFPIQEYPGLLKVCHHSGALISDPELRDKDPTITQDIISKLKDNVRTMFNGVDAEPSIVEPCMYTVTPDSMFVLDRHPSYDNIIIGAGFSGHGFKMAPVVGKILSQLALREKPSYDLYPYRISRFQTHTKSSL